MAIFKRSFRVRNGITYLTVKNDDPNIGYEMIGKIVRAEYPNARRTSGSASSSTFVIKERDNDK